MMMRLRENVHKTFKTNEDWEYCQDHLRNEGSRAIRRGRKSYLEVQLASTFIGNVNNTYIFVK